MRNLDYLQFLMRLVVELLNILERKSERIKINHTQTAVGLLVGCCRLLLLLLLLLPLRGVWGLLAAAVEHFSLLSDFQLFFFLRYNRYIDSLAKQFVVFSLRPPRCVCVCFNRLSDR